MAKRPRPRKAREAELRDLEHRQRNELWTLQMRRDLAVEETERRREKLAESLAAAMATLDELVRRKRARSA